MCDGSGPICGVLVDGGKLRSFWCNTILLFSDVTAPLPPVGLQPRQLCPLRWLQPPPRCAIVGRAAVAMARMIVLSEEAVFEATRECLNAITSERRMIALASLNECCIGFFAHARRHQLYLLRSRLTLV